MKHFDVLVAGGYALDTSVLEYISDSIKERDTTIAAITGDKKILSGLILNAGVYSDGIVVVGGKLYHFHGGPLDTKVSIQNQAITRPDLSGLQKPSYINAFVEFGAAGTGAFDFSELIRWYPNGAQIGEVKLFHGDIAKLEFGWHECDGTNGTPNYKGRVPVGLDTADVDYNVIDKTGGVKEVTLSENQIPAHKHDIKLKGGESDAASSGTDLRPLTAAGTAVTVQSENKGGSGAHENRQPFIVTAYIMFTGV